jgi:hypothetical protein
MSAAAPECSPRMDGLLGRYIDNDVTAQERIEVEAHLSGCADCQEFVLFLLGLQELWLEEHDTA